MGDFSKWIEENRAFLESKDLLERAYFEGLNDGKEDNLCYNHDKRPKIFCSGCADRIKIKAREESLDEAATIFDELHDALDATFDEPDLHGLRSVIGIKFDIFKDKLESLRRGKK